MTGNKRVSRVAVVHGCFSEGDDSIRLFLGAFASKAARQLTSLSG